MRIPNRFNGYFADGRRLYNDPVTLAAIASTGTGAAMGTAAATTALGTGIAAGTTLAGGAAATGLGAGLASAATPAATSALTAAAPSALQTAGLEAAKQQAISQGLGNAAANQATNLSVQNAIGGQASNLASSAGSNLASAAGNNAANYSQVADAFSRPNLGQGFPKLGPDLAGPVDSASLATNAAGSGGSGTTQLVENIRNANTAMNGPVQQSLGQGMQGIGANSAGPLATPSPVQAGQSWWQNAKNLASDPSMQGFKDYAMEHPFATSTAVGLGTSAIADAFKKDKQEKPHPGTIRPYEFERTTRPDAFSGSTPGGMNDSSERRYFDEKFTALEPYRADRDYKAEGGLASVQRYQAGGITGGFPTGQQQTNAYALDTAIPTQTNPIMGDSSMASSVGPAVDQYTGEPTEMARGGIAGYNSGGHLGGYSDGGRLLKGPGDGVSDSIPASIGGRQPARLADGEFVIPARVVSEIGNGSTEAGARKLYQMMDRVQAKRKKSVGKGKVAVDSKAHKELGKL
jgi:hypothetical protein